MPLWECLVYFVARIQEEEHMRLDYMLRDAELSPHILSIPVLWVHIRFSNWLYEQWTDRNVVFLQSSIKCGFSLS